MDDDDPSGEIIALATCEEMESFQRKIKKESYLLETCQDYLNEIEDFALAIRIVDVEFQMNGSLNVYYRSLSETG